MKKRGGGPGGDRRLFYIALGALLVGGVGTLSYLAISARDNVRPVDPSLAPIANQGHVMGSEGAPVEVVEFADFECPACGSFANLTKPDVRARLVNTGQVRYRFVDMPLDIHQNTWAAHNAAWCASEQGRFWEMHDLIFQNQDRWSTQSTRRPNGVLTPLARQLGLNIDQYEQCVDGRKFYPQIKANYDEAVRRGIGSTPTFVIGGSQVTGAISYDEFKRHVDRALAAAPRSPAADTGRAAPPAATGAAARPR